jgi:hypothetical protein
MINIRSGIPVAIKRPPGVPSMYTTPETFRLTDATSNEGFASYGVWERIGIAIAEMINTLTKMAFTAGPFDANFKHRPSSLRVGWQCPLFSEKIPSRTNAIA